MIDKALEVYEKMKSENIEVSSVTYGCLINACIKNNNIQKAFDLYEGLKDDNIEMNTILYTTLIKAYTKNKNLKKVLEIFDKMKNDKNNLPNNVTYNSVIDCCIKCDKMNLAEIKHKEMLAHNIKPDIITYSTLIKGINLFIFKKGFFIDSVKFNIHLFSRLLKRFSTRKSN